MMSCRARTGVGSSSPTSAARARRGGAHRPHPAHRRAEIDHGLGPAAVLERLNRAMLRAQRPTRPVRDRRACPAHPYADGRQRPTGQRRPSAAAGGARRRGHARVRARDAVRRVPGRHLDRGDIRPEPRRDHGALHRWRDRGARRRRALRGGSAGARRGPCQAGPPTRSPTSSSPMSTRSNVGNSSTTSRSWSSRPSRPDHDRGRVALTGGGSTSPPMRMRGSCWRTPSAPNPSCWSSTSPGWRFVDSTGVRLILAADERARQAGRRVALRLGDGLALRVFSLGLLVRFDVLDAR